jgi:hypothetical protein
VVALRACGAAAVVIGLVLTQAGAPSAQGALDDACKAHIGARFREWTMASVSAPVAERARARGFDPTVARGDFDGDGRTDVALLVHVGPTLVLGAPQRIAASRVVVCLNRPSGVAVHVIDEPYCGDYIERAPKGEQYHDIENDRKDVYPLDGVITVCFKQASATFLYDGAGFRRIVTGD